MNASAGPSKSYSPFWPLWGVFAVLVFLQTEYVLDDFNQRSQILATRAQLKSNLTKAETINQTTEAVGRELVSISTNSPEAAKIISEFKIKINSPAAR